MPERLTVRGEGITAELLLWRRHGVRGQALIEEMLDLNPGLADFGPIIPPGTELVLPDLPATDSFVERTAVTLFG